VWSKRLAFGLSALLASSLSILASEVQDLTYFCVEEFSGGLHYDETAKKWRGATFRADTKFILRLKHIRSRTQKDFIGKDEQVQDYDVTITESGSSVAKPCHNYPASKTITLDPSRWLRCSDSVERYIFNLNNNRFLSAYLYGYVNGKDTNEDTPHVGGGTCTKIE
jgi:hypothetical protein